MEIFKTCVHGQRMNCWESLCVQTFQQQGLLIQEQQTLEFNPLYILTLTTDRYTEKDI
jgi:hypothetical protein